MYTIAVCDDKKEDRDTIYKVVLEVFDRLNINARVTLFENPFKLIENISTGAERYDLLILDVVMKGKNGIELAETVRALGSGSHIIFITTSRDYAIDGYKVRADDYILKPITVEALADAVGRIIKGKDMIALKSLSGSTRLIATADILWAEVFGHTVHIYQNEDSIEVRNTLDNLADKLPGPKFVRCHRSYIINLDYVKDINKTRAVMKDGQLIPISRRYSEAVQRAVVEHTEDGIKFY